MIQMDKQQVYKTFEVFYPQDEKRLIEVRMINPNSKTDIWSGYFYDYEKAWEEIIRYDNGTYNFYFPINTIDERCYSMSQRDRLVRGAETTKDKDITTRDWVLIDIDTEKGHLKISSTEKEWQDARMKTHQVRNYLKSMGFSDPVVCSSGNGLHLLYKVDRWANTDTNTRLVERFLLSLSALFSDDKAEIDKKVFNAGRITKFYGTVAHKGVDCTERPHRLSRFLLIPEEIKTTDKSYFEKIANILPDEKESRTTQNFVRNYENFDIDEFIRKHNIQVAKDTMDGDTRKIVLKECPFGGDAHSAPDSAIFVMKNGAIGFSCFHSSCAGYTWKDVRLKYEPDAYDKKEYNNFQYRQRYNTPQRIEPIKPLEETAEKGKVWLKMSDIRKPSFSFADFIPSGITELDRRGVGFKRGMVSVWTGKRGCGKSSLLNMLILNAAQKGYKSALWTGELTCDTAKTWLYLQAAGKQYNERQYGTDYYSTPDHISAKIDTWIDKYFWLFNNKYGENFSQIEDQIRKLKESENIDVVLLDNLMVLDLRSLDENKYDRQSILLQKLTDLAKELNIHIHLVAHPHKSLAYIQVDNISGSGDISNKADNVFVLSRIDTGFRSVAEEYLGKMVYQDVLDSACSNIIEVGKFRSRGTLMGMVIKLWFEEESNRLKSDKAENVIYGWVSEPKQSSMNFQSESSHDFPNMPFDAPLEEEQVPF